MTPRTILFPTDFSGRCDRARERAAQLASEWRARLVLQRGLGRAGRVAQRARDGFRGAGAGGDAEDEDGGSAAADDGAADGAVSEGDAGEAAKD